MKAEEIRQLVRADDFFDGLFEKHRMMVLGEIAAQLAEMNDHLAKLANPPMMVVHQESPSPTPLIDNFKKHGRL